LFNEKINIAMKVDDDFNIKPFEINDIMEKLSHYSGYDLGQYSKNFTERLIVKVMMKYRLKTGTELLERLTNDPKFCVDMLLEFSIPVTEAFRDPDVFAAIRKMVMPTLSTYPFIKIWHAGCASGEEAYSIAIILHEMGLLERSKIYATDINPKIILRAEQGMFFHKRLELYASNYQKAKGNANFLEYVTQQKHQFHFKEFLRKNIIFLHHNLIKDNGFDNINFIFCRNVLIYFNPNLQIRILQLFNKSLVPRGFLCTGNQENISLIDHQKNYEFFTEYCPIFRKCLKRYSYV
jgi:chemotaxis protein methyltransferase CheR